MPSASAAVASWSSAPPPSSREASWPPRPEPAARMAPASSPGRPSSRGGRRGARRGAGAPARRGGRLRGRLRDGRRGRRGRRLAARRHQVARRIPERDAGDQHRDQRDEAAARSRCGRLRLQRPHRLERHDAVSARRGRGASSRAGGRSMPSNSGAVSGRLARAPSSAVGVAADGERLQAERNRLGRARGRRRIDHRVDLGFGEGVVRGLRRRQARRAPPPARRGRSDRAPRACRRSALAPGGRAPRSRAEPAGSPPACTTRGTTAAASRRARALTAARRAARSRPRGAALPGESGPLPGRSSRSDPGGAASRRSAGRAAGGAPAASALGADRPARRDFGRLGSAPAPSGSPVSACFSAAANASAAG